MTQELSSRVILPLDDVARVVDLIQRVTDRPREEVIQRLIDESRGIGTNVSREMRERNIPFNEWCDPLIEFYEQTDAFIYETSVWNASGMKRGMRKWMAKFLTRHGPKNGERTALSYGDGLGFDSVFLSQLGYRVTSYDVSRYGADFCRSVFEQNSVDVELVTDEADFSEAGYDVVLCLDVLEHLPEPLSLVQKIISWMRPGGLLIANAPFYLTDRTRSTHLRSNRRYSGDLNRLFTSQGLRAVSSNHLWAPIGFRLSETPIRRPFFSRVMTRLQQLSLLPGRFWLFPYSVGARVFAGGHSPWVKQLIRLQSEEPSAAVETNSE